MDPIGALCAGVGVSHCVQLPPIISCVEVDGTWREATIYSRNGSQDEAVIWFGGTDFEGAAM